MTINNHGVEAEQTSINARAESWNYHNTQKEHSVFLELFTHDIIAQSHLLRAIIKDRQQKKRMSNLKGMIVVFTQLVLQCCSSHHSQQCYFC